MSADGIRALRLLIRHGWVKVLEKDYWQYMRECTYICRIDGRELPWRALTQHFKYHHTNLYNEFLERVKLRDFAIHKELQWEDKTIPQTVLEVMDKKSTILPQTIDGVYYCECGGHYINFPSNKKEHERTKLHQSHLTRIQPNIQLIKSP